MNSSDLVACFGAKSGVSAALRALSRLRLARLPQGRARRTDSASQRSRVCYLYWVLWCGFVKWDCGLVARMVGNFSDVLVVVVGVVFWAVGVLMVALGLVVLVAAFGRRHGFHVVG